MSEVRFIQTHPLVKVEIYRQIIDLAAGVTKTVWHVFFHARKGIDAVPAGTDGDWHQVAYVCENETPHGLETTVRRFEILPRHLNRDSVSASPFGILYGMSLDLLSSGLLEDVGRRFSPRQRMVPWYDSFTGWLADECGFRVVGFDFEGFDDDRRESLEEAINRYLHCTNKTIGTLASTIATLPWAAEALVKEGTDDFFYIQGRPYFQELMTWAIQQRWHFPVMSLSHFDEHIQMIRERFEPYCR